MINLKCKIGDMLLNTPFIGASGTFGNGTEFSDFLHFDAIGGFVCKGITALPQQGNFGRRIVETPSGILNSIGLQNIGLDEFIENVLPELADVPCSVIANVSGKTVEEFAEMSSKLDRLDQDALSAIELNLSCPNLKKDGVVFASDPDLVYDITKKVKAVTDKTILVKLTPNVTDIKVIAKAAEEAGADGLCLINTILGMAIDVENAKPVLGNVMGGLSGPAIKPVGVRMVFQAAEAVSIPIIGIGGIETIHDALEYFMAGAAAVQVGTANLYQPDILERLGEELLKYCEEKEIRDYSQIIGQANPGFSRK